MLSEDIQIALSTLTRLHATNPELEEAVRAHFRAGGESEADRRVLPQDARAAAQLLRRELPELARSAEELAALAALYGEPAGEVLLAFSAASAFRRDVRMAPILVALAETLGRDRIVEAARARVVEGPLLDALSCAPLLGDGEALASAANAEARARLEILIWEAGASALEVPELGPWLWGSPEVFELMVRGPAHGALRGRVLAARCLEISVRGMPRMADPELIGRTLQVLQPLLLHPEPLVWVHAARALGRLTGVMEELQGTLLDWVFGESVVLRQRATTAFASLPAERLAFLASQLVAILDSREEEAWVLAAVAAATPYLFFERKTLWDRLARRVLEGDGGAIAARALARGLATLFRRGVDEPEIEATLRALREKARYVRVASIDESRRWIEVIAVTDVIDRAERDPLDLELGLENLMRLAAQYDDEEADARAARFASSLAATFHEARRIALGWGRLRQRAAALNALESSARAFAVRLWRPLLATRPTGVPVDEPELEETWKTLARSPAEILDLVAERRRGEKTDVHEDLALEVVAVRLGGYALDACGEDDELGSGLGAAGAVRRPGAQIDGQRGPTAHDTCLWLRKLEGLGSGSREFPPALKNALSALLWRLVDTTRGTALGEVDDVRWLGPFAAWWALVIDRPAMLRQLATSLPMMAPSALARCCEQAEALRTAVSSAETDAGWSFQAEEALVALHAEDTELSRALSKLAMALEDFGEASGPKSDLEIRCIKLVLAGDRLQASLADPVKALHTASEDDEDSLPPRTTQNAPRVAALVARAIRARELGMLDVWFASLGPVASALLEGAVRGAIRRTPPPPPTSKKKEPKLIEGYELVKPLGEGGIGSVWLVHKPGADRLFVLKIPKADALASANETERAGILASFVEEANALAGLYHPNVANIIDRGVSEGAPFLVLEYLIGADLKQYATARLMTLFELRQVVLDACAGLAALHGAGLVHRDIKPANLWLRLPLAGGERFDPEKHRDPGRVPPLSTVVIDFGMVRAIRVPPEVGGRFVAGTPGYIAPEQVLDPVELDPRSDVYALAGTIYNVTTGRSFFDELTGRDRILAHMRLDPFDDAERLRGFPAAVAKLLRAATTRDPAERPSPLEFGREFAASL
ncbi:serine/threonine-protein kinase [Polyangium mundeleinium]|uniref:Serine/threonine-protein kinase n=1 Tax=Polyangium mundeleinium TaxID=2995306 RepID=A0ABT5ETY5_9BACT|nr:serine/threonine-protein kinase [Polyangium mundeleinium]MDC0744206.1 serine/threonine-protein kinase [Polyangium mundeleinium]